MKKLFFLLLALFIGTASFAQSRKFNSGLALTLGTERDSTKILHLLVQGDIPSIKELVAEQGGQTKAVAGSIASIQIPLAALKKLVNNPALERLEYNMQRDMPLMDSVFHQNCNIDSVYEGLGQLTQGYDGSNVLVGILETGIDFTHSDFKYSNGSSRIVWMWDMTQTGANTPQPYGYGVQYSRADIDAGLAFFHPSDGTNSHGNIVSSILVGDGDTCQIHRSVAPGAEILFVTYYNSSAVPATYVEDAVSYIFAKADSLGKPCVVNLSLGGRNGSHDGLDLRTQFLENLLEGSTGKAIVAAAGNDGSMPYHLQHTAVGDTAFIWLKKPSASTPYIELYGDSAEMVNLKFAIGADNQPAYLFRGRTSFASVGSMPLGLVDTLYILNTQNDTLAHILRVATVNQGVYGLEYLVGYSATDSLSYYFRVMVTGSGHFNAWSVSGGGTQYFVPSTALPSVTSYPPMSQYMFQDSSNSVMSGFQNSPRILTVGNYYNTQCYQGFDGAQHCESTYSAGAIYFNSSRGPTRDGRIKPDISAPGTKLVAGTFTSAIAGLNPANAASCGIHRYLQNNQGYTSFSAPVVTGIVACFLQKEPLANWQEIRERITSCTTTDVFTGAVPNNRYGYGKVNAYKAFTCCVSNSLITLVANGGGSFCDSAQIGVSVQPGTAEAGTVYFQGTNPSGTSQSSAGTMQTVFSSGTYYFRALNTCGWGPASAVTVTLNHPPAAISAINGPLALCSGTNATYSVTAVAGATSYTWSLPNGWSGSSVSNSIATTSAATGGTISLTASNTCGSTSQSTSVAVTTIDTTVSQNGNTFTSNANLALYQWMYCLGSTIPGATDQSFTPTTTGSYQVLVEQSGCIKKSGCHILLLNGIEATDNDAGWQILPNPNKGIFTLESNQALSNASLKIYDIYGQLIVVQRIDDANRLIHLPDLADGLYLVQLFSNGKTSQRKMHITQ